MASSRPAFPCRWIVNLGAGLLLTACMTPAEKKQMKKDLFDAQARILELERVLTDTSKEAKSTGDAAAKRIASTQAILDKIQRDIQEIRGELDALRVGVITGQMPGLTEEERSGSVASAIQALDERVVTLEKAQEELLDVIKKGTRKSSQTSSNNKRRPATTAKGLQEAFDAKRYAHVAEDAPAVLKTVKGDDKELAMYLYAESLFKLGKIRDAALRYNDFIESSPDKRYLPLAKMRMGDCFHILGDPATASLYYQELVKEFPNSDEAEKAKKKLAEIGSGEQNKG